MSALVREAGSLVRLATPIMGGMIAWTLLGLIDSLLIGSLGTTELAAASLVTAALLILQAGTYGFLLPSAILTGEAHGAADPVRAMAVLGNAWGVATLVGLGSAVLFAAAWLAVPHLRQPAEVVDAAAGFWIASGLVMLPSCLFIVTKQFYESVDRPWTSLLLLLPGLALKAPLTWLLLHGAGPVPAMGLIGAAVANAIVMLLWTGAILLHLARAPGMAPYRRGLPWPDRAGMLRQVRGGAYMGLQYVLEGGAVTVAGVALGLLGAVALAANQIAFTVGAVLYMVPLGMAAAVAVRIAQAQGAVEPWRLRPIGDAANLGVLLWMIAAALVYALLGRPIAAAFSDDPAVIETATAMFLVFALMQVFDGVQSVSLGALRGLHDTRWPTAVSLVAYWLLALPLAWLLAWPLGMGAPGIWAGFGAGIAVAAVLLFTRLRRRTAPAAGGGAAVSA
jgi:MATE family multidrug resistance protein